MNMKLALAVLLCCLAWPASAQQIDAAFLQKALIAMQGQRNGALDNQAIAEAKLAQAMEALTAAKKEIEELKSQLAVKEPKDAK